MAKFKVKTKLKQVKKGWKENIIDQINYGKVLPFISNGVSNDLVFGSDDDLVESWVDYIEYPLTEQEQALRDMLAKLPGAGAEWERYLDMAFQRTLPHTTQFQSVMSKAEAEVDLGADFIKTTYLKFLREVLFSIADEELLEDLQEDARLSTMSFSEVAERLNYPPFAEDEKNPLLLLAALPLPIYLTTSYHNFIEVALTKEGKNPRSEICYWNEHLASIPSVFETDRKYEPSPNEPLVYHLHGLDSYPTSLVLTEDDYLDFLVTISKNKEIISLPVRQALADSSLLLLGYSLRHWDFRVIFRGLVKPTDNKRRPASVSIQLEGQAEKEYLKHYLKQEARFGVYWGDPQTFMQELWAGWVAQAP
jgi:hypothetical protein